MIIILVKKKVSSSEDFLNFLLMHILVLLILKKVFMKFLSCMIIKKSGIFVHPIHNCKKIWESIFKRKLNIIYENIRIGNGEYKKIDKIKFDYRLGWTFINKDSCSFLESRFLREYQN